MAQMEEDVMELSLEDRKLDSLRSWGLNAIETPSCVHDPNLMEHQLE